MTPELAYGIKADEEIKGPSPETMKKYEYASDHFKRLNKWLEGKKISKRVVTPRRDHGEVIAVRPIPDDR